MVCGNMLFNGHFDGGNAAGLATRALLANVKVLKQLVMLLSGPSACEQLPMPPIASHTGYWPVVTILLVNTNPYIGIFVSRFPTIITWPPGSGKPVT